MYGILVYVIEFLHMKKQKAIMKEGTVKRKRLLSFGEVLWDIIEGKPHIGGAPFNLAAHAVRCRMESYLVTRVGADELGRRALSEIDRLNVKRKYVEAGGAHPTGTVTVTLSDKGQPSYVIHENVAWDFINVNRVAAAALLPEHFDVVCFGTLVQREKTSRESLRRVLTSLKSVPAFYDVNIRQNFYSKKIVVEGLKRATVLKLNDGEVHTLARLVFRKDMTVPDFARAIQGDFPVKVVLVTMGAKGCLVAEGGTVVKIKGYIVRVSDTVGSGDAFSAAFLSGWLQGKSAVEAAEMGNVLGAYVASRRGAIPDYNDEIRNALGLK